MAKSIAGEISRCLVELEIFFYEPVTDFLKISALSFVFGNQLENIGEIFIH